MTRPSRPPARPASREAFLAAHRAGRQEEALDAALRAARAAPRNAQHWVDAATACVYLGRWADAVAHGEQALRVGEVGYSLHDGLAHAHGALGHAEAVRHHGRTALMLRDRLFATTTPPAPELDPRGRTKDLIAFSLFGAQSRYCETAVLNVQEAHRLYPGWSCRFHVDDSVPPAVLQRLRDAGADIVAVGPEVRHWPGPMWRLLAADDPHARRVLFRDADAVVSAREAAAVGEWVASGRRFHTLRDACTHTELILAGLWGLQGGALPPLQPRVDAWLRDAPASPRFADQWFLRAVAWPWVRQDLLSHDSQFGFMDARPFPDGPPPARFHVGMDEGHASFATPVRWPEGTAVHWTLTALEPADGGGGTTARAVCRYPGVVRDGRVRDHVPQRWLQRLRAGSARIDVARDDAEPGSAGA